MMRLRNKHYDPPSGWVFTTDEGVVIQEKIFDLLIDAVCRHYKANSRFADGSAIPKSDKKIYTRSEIVEMVEQHICAQNQPGMCVGDDRKPEERITMDKLVAVSRALLNLYIGNKVPREIADFRAAACVPCKFNSTVFAGCWTCNAARSIVAHAIKHKTAHDKHLLICTKCGCVLGVKVWLTADIIRKTNTESIDKYPPHCWVYKILNGEDL